MAWRKCLGVVSLVVLGGAGLPLVLATPAVAATIAVTTTADVVDAGDGVTSLREAISAASLSAGADEVVLASGQTYQLTTCDGGIGQEDLNAAGDLDHTDMSGALTITGNGATIEQTCQDENERVLHQRSTYGLTLVDVSISGGDADNDGGGVNAQGAVVMEGAAIVDNQVGEDGSGGWVGGLLASGPLTMTDSSISNNRALGGGNFAGAHVRGDITMVDSHIDGNESSDGIVAAWGGPGYEFDATITMVRSTMDGNTAQGLTITAGILDMTDSSVSGNCCGFAGGVIVKTLTMVDSAMNDNTVSFPFLVGAATMDISGSTFVGNVSDGLPLSGTRMLLFGTRDTGNWGAGPVSVVVDGTVIEGNDLNGPAIFAMEDDGSGPATSVDVAVTDSVIAGNDVTPTTASPGDPWYSAGVRSDGDLTVEASVISGNDTDALQVGTFAGVWAQDLLTVMDSVVADNSAPNAGLAGVVGGEVVVSGSTVAGNASSGGVGSEAGVVSDGTIEVSNSTVTGNAAESAGVVGGDVTLDHVTVAGNVGSVVGGVSGDSLDATAGALGDAGAAPVCTVPQASVVSGGFNVVSDGSCALDDATDDMNVGDLLLGALANNGGSTPTMLPSPGSPAVGVTPVGDPLCTGVDQRGVTRPQGSGCEAGAVEITDLGGFLVDTTADTLDAAPGDGVCADTSAACSLRAAIQESNVLAGSDRVLVPASAYWLTLPGAADGGGDLDVRGDTTVVGLGAVAGDTIVDGGGIDRVFHAQGAGVDLVLENVTVTGGSTPGAGGGILGESSTTVSLSDAAVNANQAGVAGGLFGWGAVTITDSQVSLNNGTVLGGVGTFGPLEVNGSVIEGNVATRNYGGVFVAGSGPATVTDSTIAGNQAAAAGGLTTTVATEIVSTAVSDNTSVGSAGGVYAEGTGLLHIVDSTIEGNQSGGLGGGLLVAGMSLQVHGSRITGNQAATGGGLAVIEGAASIVDSTVDANSANQVAGLGAVGGTLGVLNSTISGNVAAGIGGGVLHGSDTTLDSVTITGNSAAVAGAGLYTLGDGEFGVGQGGSVDAENSIVAAQMAGGDCGGSGPIVSGGHNLESSTTCGFTSTGDLQSADPLLGVLGENGGPTPTQAPGLGSPAIDQGATTLTTDQRGHSRPTGSADDIGSVEA